MNRLLLLVGLLSGLALAGCGLFFGDALDYALAPDASTSTPPPPLDDAGGGDPVVPAPVAPAPDGSCDPDRKKCDGLCVSLLDPSYGCATSSCTPCSIAHGAAVCVDGACGVGSCAGSRADCNANATDGCEANTSSSPLHCGGCGQPCASGLVCSDGACASSCSAGKTPCDGACVDVASDPDHCGACGKACPAVANGVATCSAMTCGVSCNAGYNSCGGTCKADSATSCGASCQVCTAPANATALCAAGSCDFVCDGGFVRSGAACVCNFGYRAVGGACVPDDHALVAVNGATSCRIKSDRTISCWGKDATGLMKPPSGRFIDISLNSAPARGCAVRETGAIACWGDNLDAMATPPTGTSFDRVSLGNWGGCALRRNGSILCFPSNAGTPSGTFTAVATGNGYACAVRDDGVVVCWGVISSSKPQRIPPAGAFATLCANQFYACGVRDTEDIACWGEVSAGNVPGSFRQVSCDLDTFCAVRTDGTLACAHSTPPAGTFLHVATAYDSLSGDQSTCALRLDGTVSCWGADGYGQSPTIAP